MTTELSQDNTFTRFEFRNFGKILTIVFYSHKFPSFIDYVDLVQKLEYAIQPSQDTLAIAYANIDQYPSILEQFKVTQLPSVLITSNPPVIQQQLLYIPPTGLFLKLQELEPEFKKAFEEQRSQYYERCKTIVENNPFVVFMKGTPEQPKCKFTRQLLTQLKPLNIRFNFYDIDNDQLMRHWLKYYSNWKTFPQIFIDGKLLGGLDVFNDLILKGELDSRIPENVRLEQLNTLPELQKLGKNVILHYGSPEASELAKLLKNRNEDYKFYNVNLDEVLRQQLQQRGLDGKELLLQNERLMRQDQL